MDNFVKSITQMKTKRRFTNLKGNRKIVYIFWEGIVEKEEVPQDIQDVLKSVVLFMALKG